MDGINVRDEDPSEDVEARTKKRPKLSDEEEMAPADSGGGLSCAAGTQVENMDAESSATCSANAYQPYEEDMSKTSDFSFADDAEERFWRQEAARRLKLTKMLYSLDFVDFCKCSVDLQKELEMKGLIPPNDVGAKVCIKLRCIKFNVVHHYDKHYNLLGRLVDFAPYMPWNGEIDKQFEWLQENDHLASLFSLWKRDVSCCDDDIVEYEIYLALQELNTIVSYMQWRYYHPLIIEGHQDDLLTIVKRIAGNVRQSQKQRHEEFSCLLPSCGDFINDLVDKCKETSRDYLRVAEQVALHEEFHSYVDSWESIKHDSSINELLEDETVVTGRFSSLEKELVKESLNAKIYMLKKLEEVESYFTCLESLVRQKLDGRNDFDDLMYELAKEGLFKISVLPTKPVRGNWSPKFYELLEKARHAAFPHLPDHYVINGLLDYSFIFPLDSKRQDLEVEGCLLNVKDCCDVKCFYLREVLWRTKHYENPIYEQFGDSLKLIDFRDN